MKFCLMSYLLGGADRPRLSLLGMVAFPNPWRSVVDARTFLVETLIRLLIRLLFGNGREDSV
jgi:hypothetical protein